MARGPIKAWSFSRLMDFEKCPFSVYLKVVEKAPKIENERASRGIMIHNAAEDYVAGRRGDIIPELDNFKSELQAARDVVAAGQGTVEEEWAFRRDWTQCDWKDNDAWLRLKLDLSCLIATDHAMVIDYKSGRLFGNEIKHAEQGQLYAGCSFLRMPQVKKITTEFWYPDINDLTHVEYTPAQGARFLASFERRAKAMTDTDRFPAKPSIFACKWCDHRPVDAGGTGACKFGINVNNVRKPGKQFK